MNLKKSYILFIFCFLYFFSQASVQSDSAKVSTNLIVAEKNFSNKINDVFEPIVAKMGEFLFWDPFSSMGIYDPVVKDETGQVILDSKGQPIEKHIPIIVVWLVLGAIFFTIYMKFINFRGFRHAIQLIKGDYDNPNHRGEVSHFQALATALSGTVGLGNIAGVAAAITIGGPGATFWLIVAGFLGMSSKFVEVTLGVKYRNIDENGEVSGGPMYYLSKGLKKRNMGKFGAVLAVVFAILVFGASLGGGNMFQANQAYEQVALLFPVFEGNGAWFGLGLAFLVGIVVIGGIKSIAKVTEKLVPFMAIIYIAASLVIVLINITELHHAFSLIFHGAFTPEAAKGGVIGVLIVGFQRAAFSNEAGVGSASIAHAAVKTEEPISEGLVALLEPFIDTVVICTMTALVIIFTGYHSASMSAGADGAQLTSMAFGSVISWFPYVLLVAIFLFAFSTMISWSYYGLKGFNYLFEKPLTRLTGQAKFSKYTYFFIFLSFTVVGSASSMGAVMDFSDMMILAMSFPNIIGLIIMSPEVARDLKAYFKGIKEGTIKKYK